MTGDDSQKARTGAKGTPPARSPAISGITQNPQIGEIAPNAAPKMIDLSMLALHTN